MICCICSWENICLCILALSNTFQIPLSIIKYSHLLFKVIIIIHKLDTTKHFNINFFFHNIFKCTWVSTWYRKSLSKWVFVEPLCMKSTCWSQVHSMERGQVGKTKPFLWKTLTFTVWIVSFRRILEFYISFILCVVIRSFTWNRCIVMRITEWTFWKTDKKFNCRLYCRLPET